MHTAAVLHGLSHSLGPFPRDDLRTKSLANTSMCIPTRDTLYAHLRRLRLPSRLDWTSHEPSAIRSSGSHADACISSAISASGTAGPALSVLPWN